MEMSTACREECILKHMAPADLDVPVPSIEFPRIY